MMLRRDFLKAVAIGATGAPLLTPFESRAETVIPNVLWLERAGEEATIDFSTESGKKQVAWMLRDVKANVVGTPDVRLLQLLSWMQAWLAGYGHHVRFDVHSGLRTPATNSSIEGAAQASLHLPDGRGVFRAVDFSTRTITGEYLGRLAYLARQGGVGFYTNSDFTHNDVGNVRAWRYRR